MALKRVTISMSGKDAQLIAALIQTALDAVKKLPDSKREAADRVKMELFNKAQGK